MPINFNNKLIPVISIVVVLGLVFLLTKSCGPSTPVDTPMKVVPEPPSPEADSPADTIKTLTANVSELINEVDALRKDNATLRDERDEIESRLTAQFRSELRTSQTTAGHTSDISWQEFSLIEAQIADLTSAVERLADDQSIHNLPLNSRTNGVSSSAGLFVDSYKWVQPLDQTDSGDPLLAYKSESRATPKITIPQNATLVDATIMTALIGRVPIDGRVQDPMPFKVLTGTKNLAANGFSIKGLRGMVWSGWAVGDWTLACVTGHLNSVTYVFEDETIANHAIDGVGQADQALAWISDAHGVPCIGGERKTNAARLLIQQVLLNASKSAANSAAAFETTRSLDLLGGAHSQITGDFERYLLGQSLAEGAQSATQWLTARADQEFDAVYVPAGAQVAIHVNQEIHLDYDQGGRQLNYEKSVQVPYRDRLD